MRRLATALSALGFLWAVAATLYVLTGVGYDGISTGFTLTGGRDDAGYAGVPLVSASGVWIVGLLVGVTLLAAMPLGVALAHPERQRATTWGAGLLLLGFAVIAGKTVGHFYLPCAAVLLAAAATTGILGGEPAQTRSRDEAA